MKSLVAMTYYQLMHAMALALTFEEKPNLYFSMEFLNPDEEILERIRDTGIFNEVNGITRRGEFLPLVRELRKTAGISEEEIDEIGSSLFEEFLEPHYAKVFSNADLEEDIYIYNDFQWHYYYIVKHFQNIIGVEDGYGSLHQQIAIHMHKGDKERLYPFIKRGYFPEPLYREEKIKKIISSCGFDDLDDYYSSKLEVWDFKDIVAQNEEEFSKALLYIFDIASLGIRDCSTLYVGQPLDRSRYCNAMENYLLCRKIIRNETEGGYNVYFKPHPADRNETGMYGDDRTVCLPKSFPVEVFNYQEKKFDRLVTFGSTASSITTCAKESYKYFDKTDFKRKDVSQFIKEMIYGEKIRMSVYVIARELTPETFINIYSCIFRHKYAATNIHVLLKSTEDIDEYKEYFNVDKINTILDEYKKEYAGRKESALWYKELSWLPKWIDKYKPEISFHYVSSFEGWTIYNEVAGTSADYDYMMILDSDNPAFALTKEIISAIKIRIYPAIFFHQHSVVRNDRNQRIKIPLSQGYLNDEYNGDIINKIFHREVMRKVVSDTDMEVTKSYFGTILKEYDEYIRKAVGLSLHVDPERYFDIEDGQAYFSRKIELIKGKEKEQLIGKLANTVYEYYDWYSVVNHNALGISISEAVEEFITDDAAKTGIYRKFADAMVRERAFTNNLVIMQDNNYYLKMKPIVDIAARRGVLRRVENIERIKKKISSSKRKLRKKIRRIFR